MVKTSNVVRATSKYLLNPSSWSPDGKLLAVQENSADTGFDVWMLPLEGDRQPYPWLKTKFKQPPATQLNVVLNWFAELKR